MISIKKTSYIKKIKKYNRRYNIEKYKSVVGILFSLNKKQRDKKKFKQDMFCYKNWEQESNALPSEFHFRPKNIIVIDLFAKKDIPRVKKGVLKLFKKYYSHKFLTVARFDNDIERILAGLDQALSIGRSWYRTSIFDFENCVKLRKYVSYFEVEFLNVSSSYAAIEFDFHLSKEFMNEIQCFVGENYENKGKQITKFWKKNNKKSGAKIDIAVGGGDLNESVKSRIIYEQLEYIKFLCMRKMNRLFPLFSIKNKKLYGINVFETNIPCDDSLPIEIYQSLGMDLSDGFLLSKAEKLFVSTKTLYYENKYETDMMYVYNDQLITDYHGYSNAQSYIEDRLRYFLADMGLPIVYKNIGIYYRDQIVLFRNKISRMQMRKKSYKKLLKLKYDFENIFYDFNIIEQQIPIDNESKRLLQKLEQCDYAKRSCYFGRHSYKLFVTVPQNLWNKILENVVNLSNELDKKIEIAASLKSYDDEKRGYRIAWYQFSVAIITLYLVIYPKKTEMITRIIGKIIQTLKSIIAIFL